MSKAERKMLGWFDEWRLGPKAMKELREAFARQVIEQQLKPTVKEVDTDAEVQ